MFFKNELKQQDKALLNASRLGDELNVAQAFIDKANPNAINEEGKTGLHLAVEAGAKCTEESQIFEYKKTISILLLSGADLYAVTRIGESVFSLAKQSAGNNAILEFLLDYQACPNRSQRSQSRVIQHYTKFSHKKRETSPVLPMAETLCDTALIISPRC